MGTLDGRVAFVTGVARGQGRSHAVRLAEEGADIIGVDALADEPTVHYPLSTPADLDETTRLIEKTGQRAILTRADIRDLTALTSAVDEGVQRLGRLDIIVANAGIFSMGAVLDLDERTWQDMIDVNLTGTWHTLKAAVPHIRAGGRGGSVIITSSGAALMPPPGIGHYNASKAGVVALARTLAQEVAEKPDSTYVAVNVLPVPWVSPGDVSNVVTFLASDASEHLTGLVIPVDAGYLIKK
jgi:NAD(P)-dependent dehydrogenase (short-subunit alcohol dehydrogenase family)